MPGNGLTPGCKALRRCWKVQASVEARRPRQPKAPSTARPVKGSPHPLQASVLCREAIRVERLAHLVGRRQLDGHHVGAPGDAFDERAARCADRLPRPVLGRARYTPRGDPQLDVLRQQGAISPSGAAIRTAPRLSWPRPTGPKRRVRATEETEPRTGSMRPRHRRCTGTGSTPGDSNRGRSRWSGSSRCRVSGPGLRRPPEGR